MQRFSFTTRGVCSSQIDFSIEDGRVYDVKFTRGCSGNTQGVAKLCDGMEAKKVIELLKGVDCNGRGTSCPDQLARAIEAALEKCEN